MFVVSKTLERDATHGRHAFPMFIIWNLLATFLLYPIICLAAVIAFWSNESGFAATLAIASILHLATLWIGLIFYRRARYFVIPTLLAIASVFLFIRHEAGQPDNSPFSNGIGTVDQQIWGMTGYYRVFDEPYDAFGRTYFDWAALFEGVELSIGISLLLSAAVLAVLVLWRRGQAA